MVTLTLCRVSGFCREGAPRRGGQGARGQASSEHAVPPAQKSYEYIKPDQGYTELKHAIIKYVTEEFFEKFL